MLGIAKNGHGIHHLIGHKLRGFVTLTSLVGVSDAIRLGAKTDTVKILMIKHAHPANVKRDMRPFTVACCGNIIGHIDRHLRRHRNVL